jgi:hypothetical protein
VTSGIFAGVCSCQGGRSPESTHQHKPAGSCTCSHVPAARRLSVGFECFASPLNTRFSRFCSAFPVRPRATDALAFTGRHPMLQRAKSAKSPPSISRVCLHGSNNTYSHARHEAGDATLACKCLCLTGHEAGDATQAARVCVSLGKVPAALHRPGGRQRRGSCSSASGAADGHACVLVP